MNNLIGISGKIGSGKDTTGMVIQYLFAHKWAGYTHKPSVLDFASYLANGDNFLSRYDIKKYAGKLKDMVCLLLGCSREDLENADFKNKELGPEWWFFKGKTDGKLYPYKDEQLIFDDCSMVILTPRLILQLLGTDCGRQIIHPNIWVNALFADYHELCSWIITDVRFPNEAKAIKDRRGIVIRVERCNEDGSSYGWGNPNANHESETALDDYEFDYVINNNTSIDDLIHNINHLIETEYSAFKNSHTKTK